MSRQSSIRVLVVNPDYYRSSGVTVAIRRLFDAMRPFPVHYEFVSCLSGKAEGKQEDLSWMGASPFRRIDLMSRNPIRLFFSLVELFKLLRRGKFQILHVHHRRMALLCGPLARYVGVKVVYTGHLVYGESKAFRAASLDGVIAVTKSVRTELARDFPNVVCKTISNAVPLQELAPPQPGGPITCIGRFEAVKNHETLIRAWSGLANPERKILRLIGEGSLKDRLVALSESLEVQDTIEFVGYSDQLDTEIAGCCFCVLASHIEGQGLVTLEAAAQGRPSLVSNVPGSRDCIPGGLSLPNLFNPNDTKGLTELLQIWLSNPESVGSDGEIMRAFVRLTASPEHVAKETFSFYLSIIP